MRYLVTGGSGYIGSRLVERLAERDGVERIVVCDLRPPRRYTPRVVYQPLDVRDRAAVRRAVAAERPDVLVHLAFILNPVRDERLMYDVDVNGTQNVLDAAAESGVEQVLVTSSTTAYGAFPDNPIPLTEDDPVRGVADFSYARDKTEADRLCQLWAARHPDRVMTIVRPCIVFGPNVDNYIVRTWTDVPFSADLGASDVPIQFVHEDDLVEAVARLVEGRHAGAFNVTGDGLMTLGETVELAGLRTVRMPRRFAWALASLLWRLGRSEAPPGNIHFALHPWVASNAKLKATLGWQPRHSSRETFELTMRARGRLPEHEPAGTVGVAMLGTASGR